MPDTFAQTVRLMWIDDFIDGEGEIGSADIMRAFRISSPQASADIRRYLSRNPDRVSYDTRCKRYVVIEGSRPLFDLAARSAAFDIVDAVTKHRGDAQ